ncbi:MAG: NAD-dependent epimerase/dehydratase family protein [Candidatus Eisenbacteria bacterium]
MVEALVERGHLVRVLDDLSTGRRENLRIAEAEGRVDLTVGSIQDVELLRHLAAGCRTVYHLAASVGVGAVTLHPLECLHNNVRGFQSLFAALDGFAGTGGTEAGALERVVVFSSSEVYGKSTAATLGEGDDFVIGPSHVARWSYAAAKAMGEFLALASFRERGVPVTIIRCFNTVGPRQLPTYGMVLPRFVEQARRGEPLTVYGDGLQTRCFSYVKDVVRGVLDLAAHPGAVGEVFNIGSDEETTVLSLAERVRALLGSDSPVRLVPYPEIYGGEFTDIRRRVPNLSKIRALVSYRPETDLDGILRATIASEGLEASAASDAPSAKFRAALAQP